MDMEIVDRETWTDARKNLLAKEKAFTRARDELNADRRRMPVVRIDKDYRFTGPTGAGLTLDDLFEGRRQLVVYHAMWLDDARRACPSCSCFLDQIGHLAHLNARDTTFAAISRGPYDEIAAFKQRMEWAFPWYSSRGSDFNYDFHVTFDESVAPISYNYLTLPELADRGFSLDGWEQPFDLHGLSCFLRHDGSVFHTYSAYARGTDNLGFLSDLLDVTYLGRQEEWEEPKGRATALGAGAGSPTLRYHDEYVTS
jgi:predicted dithiol-disulfide oxidoreductase (DUF899 family)